MVGGRGWCQDANGHEGRNRYIKIVSAPVCESTCLADKKCVGYAALSTWGECVLYSDTAAVSYTSAGWAHYAGPAAGSFVITKAGGWGSWTSAYCLSLIHI